MMIIDGVTNMNTQKWEIGRFRIIRIDGVMNGVKGDLHTTQYTDAWYGSEHLCRVTEFQHNCELESFEYTGDLSLFVTACACVAMLQAINVAKHIIGEKYMRSFTPYIQMNDMTYRALISQTEYREYLNTFKEIYGSSFHIKRRGAGKYVVISKS
jgi:hypothetical protein